MLFAGEEGDTLSVDLLATLGGLLLEGVVPLDTLDESLTGEGLADVLNADVEALGDNAGVHTLVNNDTNGLPGHVEDSAGLSVVELAGHTALDGTVGDNINDVVLFVDSHQLAELGSSVLLVGNREQITGARS